MFLHSKSANPRFTTRGNKVIQWTSASFFSLNWKDKKDVKKDVYVFIFAILGKNVELQQANDVLWQDPNLS